VPTFTNVHNAVNGIPCNKIYLPGIRASILFGYYMVNVNEIQLTMLDFLKN